jgi:hypothetical protein
MSNPFRLGDPLPEYQKPVFLNQDAAVRHAPVKKENQPIHRDTISPSCSDSICKTIAAAVIAVCHCLTCPFRWIFSLFQASPPVVEEDVSSASEPEPIAKEEPVKPSTMPTDDFRILYAAAHVKNETISKKYGLDLSNIHPKPQQKPASNGLEMILGLGSSSADVAISPQAITQGLLKDPLKFLDIIIKSADENPDNFVGGLLVLAGVFCGQSEELKKVTNDQQMSCLRKLLVLPKTVGTPDQAYDHLYYSLGYIELGQLGWYAKIDFTPLQTGTTKEKLVIMGYIASLFDFLCTSSLAPKLKISKQLNALVAILRDQTKMQALATAFEKRADAFEALMEEPTTVPTLESGTKSHVTSIEEIQEI